MYSLQNFRQWSSPPPPFWIPGFLPVKSWIHICQACSVNQSLTQAKYFLMMTTDRLYSRCFLFRSSIYRKIADYATFLCKFWPRTTGLYVHGNVIIPQPWIGINSRLSFSVFWHQIKQNTVKHKNENTCTCSSNNRTVQSNLENVLKQNLLKV